MLRRRWCEARAAAAAALAGAARARARTSGRAHRLAWPMGPAGMAARRRTASRLCLASASQDGKIRLWMLHLSSGAEAAAAGTARRGPADADATPDAAQLLAALDGAAYAAAAA